MPLAKPKRVECKAYLEFVRSFPCCACGSVEGSDPHHLVTRGAGGSDYTCIPLCRGCHDLIHLHGKDKWKWNHGTDPWREACRYLEKWVISEMKNAEGDHE